MGFVELRKRNGIPKVEKAPVKSKILMTEAWGSGVGMTYIFLF